MLEVKLVVDAELHELEGLTARSIASWLLLYGNKMAVVKEIKELK